LSSFVSSAALLLAAGTAQAQLEPSGESAPFVVDTRQPRIDSDSDGMPDVYELAVGLDPFANDAFGDLDGDGIQNIQEYNAGTDPGSPDFPQLSMASSGLFTVNTRIPVQDSDSDGIPDSWEVAHGTNPFRNDAAGDPDGDGLTNLQEYNAGTDPMSSDSPLSSSGVSPIFSANTTVYPFPVTLDSDRDGMPDWWEQKYGLNPLVDDSGLDPDGDGRSNLAEFLAGGNPAIAESVTEVAASSSSFTLNTKEPRVDTDGDGIPDAWELAHGLDPLRNDALEDPDHDGRSNLEEYNSGTDPKVDDWRGPSVASSSLFLLDTGGLTVSRTQDSDGDGLPDWWEIQYGLNPHFNDAAGDADGDGISNLAEFNSGSNPRIADKAPVVGISGIFLVDTGGRLLDSDGDGLPDWWEKLYFNDPRVAQPSADPDGDGVSNISEFLAGSNPLDPNSRFRVTGLQAVYQTNGTAVTIRWASFAGSTYSIWTATVAEGPYVLSVADIAALPPENTFRITGAPVEAFFQIRSAR